MVNGETKLVKQVDSILREIEELKAIFILGQRVILFLRSCSISSERLDRCLMR
jgi:hypothetical protein